MPRKLASLQRQLDAVEEELGARLRDMLSAVAERRVCPARWFFSRKTSHVFYGRAYRTRDVAELERMEAKITALRTKLGQPVDEGVLGWLQQFVELTEGHWREPGGETRAARVILARWSGAERRGGEQARGARGLPRRQARLPRPER